MWKNETKLLLNFWLHYVISLLINSNVEMLLFDMPRFMHPLNMRHISEQNWVFIIKQNYLAKILQEIRSSLYIKLSWLLIDNRIMLSVTMGFFIMCNKNTLISEMIIFSTIRSRGAKARALPNNVFWHGNRDFFLSYRV